MDSIFMGDVMFVSMLTHYEDFGRPLGGWRHGGNRQPAYGRLHFGQERVHELRDTMNVCSIQRDRDLEPLKLYRSSLLHIASGELAITGLEHDVVSRRYTAQTWRMQVLAPERPTHEDALSRIRHLVKSSGLPAARLRELLMRLEQEETVRA